MELTALLSNRPTWTEEEFDARELEIIAAGEAMRGPCLGVLWSLLPQAEQDQLFESLTAVDWLRVLYDWNIWGRPKQLVAMDPSDTIDDVLWLCGRQFGKNRTVNETVADRIQAGLAHSICYVGADWRDVRRHMVGGLPDTDSGILDVLPPWYPRDSREGVIYNENKAEIYIPPHDCTIYLNSGEVKEQRGGNFDLVWIDEPIKYRYLDAVMANLDFALRKGPHPQRFITTTPKKQQWLRNLMMTEGVQVVHGTSEENTSLAKRVYARLLRRYGGSQIGDQELGARILRDSSNAIASSTSIDKQRLSDRPLLLEAGIGIDPAVSTKRKSDDSGIIAVGRCGGEMGSTEARLCVLEDASGRYTPDGWALKSVDLAIAYGAKWIIVERNKIGDTGYALIMHALRARGMEGKIEIREAYSTKDKATRARTTLQPLYDRGHVHHVGRFGVLESQLTQWDPASGISPNELDAFTHAAIEVMGMAAIDAILDDSTKWEGLAEAQAAFETRGRGRI